MARALPFRSTALALGFASSLVTAAAQAPPTVRTAVGYEFGIRISFAATILSTSHVTRAAVFYRPEGSSHADVLVADLVPGSPTVAQADQDLRVRPLPPFQTVEYWWQVDFADRSTVVTPLQGVRYEDDRFTWQFLAEGPFTVHWSEGDLAFARGGLDAAAAGLERTRTWLLPDPTRPVAIYVYPDVASLEAGLARTGRSWAAGHSDPSLSVILVPVAPTPESGQDFERLIPHELAHLLLFERAGAAYGQIPGWVNEGLATNMELSPDPRYRASLDQAIEQHAWLSLESICAGFPTSGEAALLAYAESASLVGYLRDAYGIGSIHALLDAYQEGASCTGGLERVLRRTTQVFETEWATSLRAGPAGDASPTVLFGIGAAAGLIILVTLSLLARRRHSKSATPPPDEP
ncbi:MAG: peptidase MA family metallohydrolase [Anaerolineales bacterium]